MKINKMKIVSFFVIGLFLSGIVLPSIFALPSLADNKTVKKCGRAIEKNEQSLSEFLITTTNLNNIIHSNHPIRNDTFKEKLYINTGLSVCETYDNEYVITGSTGQISLSSTNVNGDIILLRSDTNGSEIWMKTYCNGKVCDGWSVEQTTDAGFIIGGVSIDYSFGSFALLVKTDENGEVEWSKKFSVMDMALATQAIQTSDGGYLLTGNTAGMSNPLSSSLFLLKTDENGVMEWSETFLEKDINVGYSVYETADQDFIVAGYTADLNMNDPNLPIKNSDFLTLKIDQNGEEIWRNTIDIEKDDICNSVSSCHSGIVLSGVCNALLLSDSPDLLLVKINENGQLQMNTIIENTIGKSVEETADHGFIIGAYEGGCSAGSCLPSTATIIKTDENGTLLWKKSYQGIEQAVCNEGCITSDGGYILSGATVSSDYEYFSQILLLKTDENGNKQWENTYCKCMPDTALSVEIDTGGVLVENIGNIFAKNVEIHLKIEGGLFNKIQSTANLTVDMIIEGDKATLEFPAVFGFGNVEIISTTYCSNAKFNREEADGFVFLSFLKIKE